VAIFFAAVAPVLNWPQFSGDSEDLLVQTVLEMRNGGPWWIPTLGGSPRTRKPPLPAWISAASVSPRTVHDLSSTIPAVRESAYRRFAWEVRWPALVAACLMLLALAWTAEMIGGPAHVLPAVIICATSVLFFRYIRVATPDVHLAMFVTVANAFLVAAIVRRRWWLGCVGAGAALGLAFMCKGPVAFVETLAPVGAYLLLRKCNPHPGPAPEYRRRGKSVCVIPIGCGVLVMLAIMVPWYVSVVVGVPGSFEVWWNELKGEGAKSISHDPWYGYWTVLPNLLPWLPLFIGGVYLAVRPWVRRIEDSGLRTERDGFVGSALADGTFGPPRVVCSKTIPSAEADPTHSVSQSSVFSSQSYSANPHPNPPPEYRERGQSSRILLALLLVVVPIVILSFFHDRKERYLLPLAAPAALLAAHAATRLKRSFPPKQGAAQLVWALHWVVLLVFAIGLPLWGTLKVRRVDGASWYSLPLAAGAILCGVGFVAAGILRQSKWRISFVCAGAGLMLLLYALFQYGWSGSVEGMSEMKPVADRIHADFPTGRVVYYDPPPGGKPVTLDLDIYLNRVVPVISDSPPAKAYDGAAAVVVLRKEGDPEPSFPGWRTRFDLVSRKHHWYVLVPGYSSGKSFGPQ
jgi:4-amino-4-deoxy-L-arabinose transferase-like glycosyltransferase